MLVLNHKSTNVPASFWITKDNMFDEIVGDTYELITVNIGLNNSTMTNVLVVSDNFKDALDELVANGLYEKYFFGGDRVVLHSPEEWEVAPH